LRSLYAFKQLPPLWRQQTTLVEEILGLDWDALNIESVAPDPVGDGIEVVVSDDGDVAASDVRDGTGFGDMEQELTGALGDLGVPIRISVEEPEDPAAT